jgi:tight adherence protein C
VSRFIVAAGLLVWVGATLLLSVWSRTARPSLTERLRPFHPGSTERRPSNDALSFESFGQVLLPLGRGLGDRLAAVLGVAEPVETRLRRVHSPVAPGAFRLRQMAFSLAAMVIGGLFGAALSAPLPLAVLLVVGSPILVFLVIEQRLAQESERWQRDVARELPVVSEQLAMLLNAGYSLGSALARIAERGRGCIARDLARVVNRVQQGLAESDALGEWAELARVDGVDRLVGVLRLQSEAADLGRLISAEARQARRDLHRLTIELMERRAQQVWIPVTVATLVPGAILLAVPFLAALKVFANA